MLLQILGLLACGLLFASLLMTALWFVQRRTKNAGIVDVAWAAEIGVLGVFYSMVADGLSLRRVIVGTMIGLWSIRLTTHLFRRVVGHKEEGRYATIREHRGASADSFFFWFYQLQALAVVIFAAPILIAANNTSETLTFSDVIGTVVWFVGVGGVTLADFQLAQFLSRRESKGKTCREGLWRYSRHPNYFFEWVHWWSYVFVAFGGMYWWSAAAVPLLLLYFLFFMTGIPPTEAQALASRGDDYREYQRTTSVFVPWFPKPSNHNDS